MHWGSPWAHQKLADLIPGSIFTKLLQAPLHELLKDRVRNVRCAALRCFKELAKKISDKSAEDSLKRAVAVLSEDTDFEIKNMLQDA